MKPTKKKAAIELISDGWSYQRVSDQLGITIDQVNELAIDVEIKLTTPICFGSKKERYTEGDKTTGQCLKELHYCLSSLSPSEVAIYFMKEIKSIKSGARTQKKTPEQWEIIQIKLEKKVELKNETY